MNDICTHDPDHDIITLARWRDVTDGGSVFTQLLTYCPVCGQDISHLQLVDIQATKREMNKVKPEEHR